MFFSVLLYGITHTLWTLQSFVLNTSVLEENIQHEEYFSDEELDFDSFMDEEL